MRVPLYREAQVKLRSYIREERLRPGDPLPPESDLARDLGISRLSLREATKSLETLGVIRTVPGKGLFVGEFSFDPIIQQLPYDFDVNGAALAEILVVREAIERGLIVRARKAMSPADLTSLESLVAAMASASERGESVEEIDRRFHLALFAPLGNGMANSLIELFWDLFHKLRGSGNLPEGDQHAVDVHVNIVAALRDGSPAAMTAAMDAHFEGIRSVLGLD